MDAIETRIITAGEHTYRIAIYPDEDSPNPLEAGSEMGILLSLNRRHRNFDPDRIAAEIEHNGDAVQLSYFEHGRCLWSVAGEQPAAGRCPWDSVPFAGVWVPDAETLASAARYSGRTRQLFLRKRAREACDAYSKWCNGENYGYIIERIIPCTACGQPHTEEVAQCGGYGELEDCLADAVAAAEHRS